VGSRLGPDVQQDADELLGIRETQLRQALALANSGSWEWDVAANVVTWSPELRSIIGVGPEFEASAQAFNSFVHPDDLDWVLQVMGESLRTGVNQDVQFRFVRPDGCVRLFRGCGLAIRYEDGKPAYLVGLIQDLGSADACDLLVSERAALQSITAREREVLLQVVRGGTSKAIAEALGLSPKTVETYRSRIMSKLRVDDLAGLIRFSIRNGLTKP
jgi:PAS domain S-box-containing protein